MSSLPEEASQKYELLNGETEDRRKIYDRVVRPGRGRFLLELDGRYAFWFKGIYTAAGSDGAGSCCLKAEDMNAEASVSGDRITVTIKSPVSPDRDVISYRIIEGGIEIRQDMPHLDVIIRNAGPAASEIVCGDRKRRLALGDSCHICGGSGGGGEQE